MKKLLLLLLLVLAASPTSHAFDKQPASIYRARRVALAARLNGGVAILFAAPEPLLDFDPYRQDSDFFYLTGWTEPGAALLVSGTAANYHETLFLPTRNLRMELYTGVKLDAATPHAAATAGVDAVQNMTELPAAVNALLAADRRLARGLYTEPGSQPAQALLQFVAATLGQDSGFTPRDVSAEIMPLRQVKDEGEIALLRQASQASIAAQFAMMRAVRPGATERAVAGQIHAAWLAAGCERPSYAPIVGSGINSTILHYAANERTIQAGDIVNVDAACEYSMYASDITRAVPASGHFTERQREIYNIVLGAQQAAIQAFQAGKSKINDRDRLDPDSLDTAAYNYINTHGHDLHGQPLGHYWLHGLGHMVGIDVHDPAEYPALLRPGMVFTIEPGIYIPEEALGIRIECVFLVGQDGKLIDLTADLPHTAEDVEKIMEAARRP